MCGSLLWESRGQWASLESNQQQPDHVSCYDPPELFLH